MRRLIHCKKLSVSYQDRLALGPLNCSLSANSRIAILGPNGGGKSTFLKALLGTVAYRGAIENRAKSIAYIAQRQEVDWSFPLTALDVTMMGLYKRAGWFRRMGQEQRVAGRRALARLAMEKHENSLIGSLSVGQQQRVFVARAIVDLEADLFLFDEPCAGVDARTEQIIYQIFTQLIAEGKSILCVHHDLRSAAAHFDEAILLNQELVASGSMRKVLSSSYLNYAYQLPTKQSA